MARKSSSRGFAVPLMIVGTVLVGLLAVVGVNNILQKSVSPAVIASQTIQGNGSVQKIADSSSPTLGEACVCGNSGSRIDSAGKNVCPLTGWEHPNDGSRPACGSDAPFCMDEKCEKTNDRKKIFCDHNSDCSTNICIFGRCREENERLTSGKNCDESADCLSGNCGIDNNISFKNNVCLGITDIELTPKPSAGGCKATSSQKFSISPCGSISEATPTVTTTWSSSLIAPLVGKDNKYYYCLKSSVKDCSEDDWNKQDPITTSLTVCGDGASALKTGNCNPDGGDWFHAGKVYNVFLAQGKNSKLSASDVVATASFYVGHFRPQIVQPKPAQRPDLNMAVIKDGDVNLTVTLQGRNTKGGKNDSDSNTFNDYSVRVIGVDNEYKSAADGCIYVPLKDNDKNASTGTTNILLSHVAQGTEDNPVYLSAGQYAIQIKDGIGDNSQEVGAKCTEGDFTLYDIPFTIGEDKAGNIYTEIWDPKGKETAPNLTPPPAPAPICFQKDKDPNGYCTGIPTALGFTIHTEPTRFIGDIFTIVLSIGGIAAILFFIQAGYGLMTSAGNKEKVAASREQITAAVLGLLFIILSITILEFIGINILHIPGFCRPGDTNCTQQK